MNLTLIHAYVDHFSIVLVFLGILLEYRANLKSETPNDGLGWGALRLGLAFWLLSVLTGYASQAKVVLDPTVQQLLNYHQAMSLIAFATLAVAILLRILSRTRFYQETEGAALRGAYYAILSITLMLVLGTVYLGTKLVYAHGVGVQPYQELLQSAPVSAPTTTPATADSTQH